MNKKYTISIGIEDLIINLKSCIHNPALKAQIFVNLRIDGDFLPAAKSDALNQTVDYDILGQHIAASIESLSCTEIKEIRARLVELTKDFSSLISGGFIESRLSCDTAFLNHRSLL